jgi:regulator of nucleoside diphosphate kinase
MGQDPCMLTARDGYILDRMLRDWPPLTDEWLALLRRKATARRLPAQGRIPDGLAMIDARVSFRCASGLTDMRTLCLPGTYAPGSAFLPVTTFYGLALLGLREGQSMAFDRPEGRRDWIVLEKVLFQPAIAEAVLRTDAQATPPALWLIAGGLVERSFAPANENGPETGPGPSAA